MLAPGLRVYGKAGRLVTVKPPAETAPRVLLGSAPIVSGPAYACGCQSLGGASGPASTAQGCALYQACSGVMPRATVSGSPAVILSKYWCCLLYTSDAADE